MLSCLRRRSDTEITRASLSAHSISIRSVHDRSIDDRGQQCTPLGHRVPVHSAFYSAHPLRGEDGSSATCTALSSVLRPCLIPSTVSRHRLGTRDRRHVSILLPQAPSTAPPLRSWHRSVVSPAIATKQAKQIEVRSITPSRSWSSSNQDQSLFPGAGTAQSQINHFLQEQEQLECRVITSCRSWDSSNAE